MRRITAFLVAAALAAVVLAPTAFAGDQVKLQQKIQLQDGSCATCPG